MQFSHARALSPASFGGFALAALVACSGCAQRAATSSLEISRTQVRLGAVSYLSLLNAEQTYQTARRALVQAQAGRLADTAALFQAPGGGWWNRSDVAAEAANAPAAKASPHGLD